MGKYASVYFSPQRGAADQVIGFISRCNTYIDAAVYSITHDGIAQALMDAHARGVKVRVLIDKSQAGLSSADDEKLEAVGIPVRRDTQPGLMHDKIILGDGTAVGTGSFNWTANADQRNTENFVVLRLKYIVDEFQSEFDNLWEKNAPE